MEEPLSHDVALQIADEIVFEASDELDDPDSGTSR
jgi:hypothetical protein